MNIFILHFLYEFANFNEMLKIKLLKFTSMSTLIDIGCFSEVLVNAK